MSDQKTRKKKIYYNPRWVVEGIEKDIQAQTKRAELKGYEIQQMSETRGILQKKGVEWHIDWFMMLFIPFYALFIIATLLFPSADEEIWLDINKPAETNFNS